jgi:NAD+ diphosphatase
MNNCNKCGGKLIINQPGISWDCEQCKKPTFANPVPTVDVMFYDEDGRILLGRRSRAPHLGKLNLPGGFVDPNETLEVAIKREIHEELGLSRGEYAPLVYASSSVRQHTGRQTIVVIYTSHIGHRDFAPNDEVSEFVWIKPEDLKPDDTTLPIEYDHIMMVHASQG